MNHNTFAKVFDTSHYGLERFATFDVVNGKPAQPDKLSVAPVDNIFVGTFVLEGRRLKALFPA